MNKRNVLFTVIAIVAIAAVALAVVPPPPVNQNIHMRDTSLYYYTESQCRDCHNSTELGGVPTRHHGITGINPETSLPYACTDCHPLVGTPGGGHTVLFDRNCKACHNGTVFYGTTKINLFKPHHIDTASDSANIGQPAQTRQCDVCHGSVVDNYNDSHYMPPYATSLMITPFADYKAKNQTTGKLWGGCRACHWKDGADILTNNDTHHIAIRGSGGQSGTKQTNKTPGETCSWCHVEGVQVAGSHGRVNVTINGTITRVMELRNSTKEQLDFAIGAMEPGTTNISINGTGCEKCHSVESIHNIQYDYDNTSGQLGYGHIGTSWDCNGCHASWDAGSAPLGGAIIPYIDSVEPSVFIAGQARDVTILGGNFKQEDYSTTVYVDGVSVPTTASDSQIVATVPALTAGVHTLQVVKGDSKTKLVALTVVTPVAITSAILSNGVITTTGSEFGAASQKYVTIKNKNGIVSYSDSITIWGNSNIVAKSKTAAVGDIVTVTTLTGSATSTITAGTVVPSITSITVTSPNGGNWKRGTTQAITWTSSGNPGANVKIELLRGSKVVSTIAKKAPNSGNFNWKISRSQSTGTTYKIRVTSTTRSLYQDTSDNYFQIPRW